MIDLDEIRKCANHEPRIPVGYETTMALCDEVERLQKERAMLIEHPWQAGPFAVTNVSMRQEITHESGNPPMEKYVTSAGEKFLAFTIQCGNENYPVNWELDLPMR